MSYNGPIALRVSAPGGQADSRVAPLIKMGRNMLGEMEARAQITGQTAIAASKGSEELGTVRARWTPYVKQVNVEVVATPEKKEDLVEEEKEAITVRKQIATEVYREEERLDSYVVAFNQVEQNLMDSSITELKEKNIKYNRIVRIVFELSDGNILEIVTPRGQQLGSTPTNNLLKAVTSRGKELSSNANGKPNSDYLWLGGESGRGEQFFTEVLLSVTSEMIFTPEETGVYKDSGANPIKISTKVTTIKKINFSDPILGKQGTTFWKEIKRNQEFVTTENSQFLRTKSITFYRFLEEKKERQFLQFVYVEPTINDLKPLDS